ncbi:SpoIIE family protein phosphatase [Fusobacterium mortiferum]|jgi:sigma-B regulation protein RsbU (phosphoserine phosphatase)|uniref:SpoIIE family protein phosphatase n=1 Tax=Fusobacterium mortiferum TaxID=850 RepID=UPI001F202B4A|nr:SpoIIE family protein phosphatase [Fusobacterium mortiferum]MCF2698376.1 SpoIIE family protein phosphatase [Fusobacterium mortiferum]MCI7665982.1 SpoIIE family protein phosphatase [Fusobacterium mortiferum]MDD7261404.1 SpoIIE family protein phosphatase [Fusobacterium mortiferum]MDY5980980.1 SpoIIE family protein phosphatase [Fusobacterium mortiferum]
MIYFIFILVIGLMLYYSKKKEEEMTEAMMTILTSIRNKKQLEDVPEILKEEYEDTIKNVIKQDLELENSIGELREYRKELEETYNSLVQKSTQLEYSNQILERRVENLSNLNSLSRAVLSVLDLDNIINIILDAYFVLTGAKRISLYLWEAEGLINKKTKGECNFKENLLFSEEEIKEFTKKDYQEMYEKLSKKFILADNEVIVISPLVVKEKQLGVIYVIEDKNKLIDLDEETISALVIQVSIAINNAQIYSELIVKERMSNELDVASRIQKKILPADVDEIFGLEIAQYFEPAKEIGGDYYDYTILDDNVFSITIADVSGKGVPAAFLMALGRSVLKTLTLTGDFAPNENLNELNKIIYSDITEDMFITMMHSKYNKENKTLYYSNAGHNPLVVYRASTDSIELHTVKGVAIGFLEEYKYRQGEIQLNKGDIVIFYTDGITEAENSNKEMFGLERLKEVIYNNKNKSPKELRKVILESINRFRKDYEQTDDLTFVILKSNV